jgi:hypothetical protein
MARASRMRDRKGRVDLSPRSNGVCNRYKSKTEGVQSFPRLGTLCGGQNSNPTSF